MYGLQPQDLIIILVIALFIFGPGRLPELSRSLGKTFGEFKHAIDEGQRTAERAASSSAKRQPADVQLPD